VDRTTRCIVAWEVCFERTPKLLQSLIDQAPHAAGYFSDAFNTYRELCYWGTHTAMKDKSETYSVEGVNADLRHYLARLARKSRCFSRCIKALRRAVDLFVRCYNARQLRKRKYPHYPAFITDALAPYV
jgi:insertion element IS1 protein InsB